MRKLVICCFLFITLHTNGQLLSYGGQQFFLNGANICWKNYGWDFGDNAAGYGGGNGYDATWWENTFTAVESYKGNSVRVWVHCKGEHNPLFDGTGKCTGLNTNFYANLDDLLQRAENHNLMVILCLFDFHLVDVARESLIKDTSKTNAYIKNALIPMVQHYETQCNLLSWEIINEPEWIMTGISGGGNHGSGGISINQMQRFVGMCASAIHSNSTKMATVGSASLKWNATLTPAVGNYWSDAVLKAAAYNDAGAYLDFYQIHYYDWMGSGLSPYGTTKASWGLNKPVLVGETGNEGFYTYQQQYDYSYSNGYAGCMPWAYESGGAATWNDFNNEMLTFRNAHSTVVDFDCDVLSSKHPTDNKLESIKAYQTKSNEIQVINLAPKSTLKLLNMQGQEYATIAILDQTSVTIPNTFTAGIYILLNQSEKGNAYYKLLLN